MKRALIICYYWPPSGGSGVQRWLKFAKYLPGEGWQPVVYTPENPELTAIDTSLENEIPAEAEVIKTRIVEPYGFYRRLTGGGADANGPVKQKEVNPINGGKKSLKQKISMFIRGNFFIPDPRCLWVAPSVKFLKKYVKENPVDIIVSSGPPHSMHLIAMKLSEATGLPWIADFRDPWTKLFYLKHLPLTKWAKKRNRVLEQSVLDNASAVVAVTPLVQEDFQAVTATPVECITNGYDEEDFDQVVEADGCFNLTHTGLLASDGNPTVLWRVLGEKCREDEEFKRMMRLRLVGKVDSAVKESIYKNGLAENMSEFGYQNHVVATREQIGASVLLLPLRYGPELKAIIPGKMFEYLAAGHPILGFGQTDGAMARIINSSKAGVVFEWEDYDSTKKYIDICWNRFKEGTLMSEAENISQYSRRELTGRMARLMESVMNIKME